MRALAVEQYGPVEALTVSPGLLREPARLADSGALVGHVRSTSPLEDVPTAVEEACAARSC